MKTKRAKKIPVTKKATTTPKDDENEEIDVGDATSSEVTVNLNDTGRGKNYYFYSKDIS